MTSSEIPPGYIQRENAEAVVGKSPKTIFRHIKKAIETGGDKEITEHCCLQLLDGTVIEGTHVASMKQIDDYRREGKVPSWYIDPDFFREYFSPKEAPATGPSKQPDTEPTPSRTVGEGTGPSVDPAIIDQYELRLKEKDEQIAELRRDKTDLRQQLQANTNLTERITNLLSHSQLAALGVPEGMQSKPDISDNRSAASEIVEAEVLEAAPGKDKPSEEPHAGEEGTGATEATNNALPKKAKQTKATTKRTPRKTSKKKRGSKKAPPRKARPTVKVEPPKPAKKKKWYNTPIGELFSGRKDA